MKSIGGRCKRWKKANQENLKDWIKSKTWEIHTSFTWAGAGRTAVSAQRGGGWARRQ